MKQTSQNEVRRRFKDDFFEIMNLLKANKVKTSDFFLPVSFLISAGIFEILYIGLFAPVAQGIVRHNFRFLQKMPVFHHFENVLAYTDKSHFLRVFIILAGLMILCNVLRHASIYVSGLMSDRISAKYTASLQNRIISRYLSFGQAFYDLCYMGHLRLALIGFTKNTGKAIVAIQRICQNIIMLFAYLGIMCFISWRLTLLSFCVIPVVYYPILFLTRKIRKKSMQQVDLKMDVNDRVYSTLTSIPLIKAYGQETNEQEKFETLNQKGIQNTLALARLGRLTYPTQDIFIMLAMVILIGAMSYFFVDVRGYRIAVLVAFLIALRKAMYVIRRLNSERIPFAKFHAPVSKIKEILSDENKFFIHSGSKEYDGFKRSIRIEGLNFNYPNREDTLQNVHLEIKKGEMVGLVGPTGAGKSALANLLMRYYEFSEGNIYFDDTDIREYDLKTYLKNVTYVPQQCYLVRDTIRKNICYGHDDVSEKTLQEVCEKVGLREFIESLEKGYDTMLHNFSGQLSQGQKQRLSLARALLRNTDLIILDEPLAALNTKAQQEMIGVIEELTRDKTSIVISHNLSLNQKADRIVVLKDGQLVEEGSIDDLVLSKGIFFTDCFKKGQNA